tara:strand:- start:9049 stop:9324 length:276 start_codon:yes stop_codon:yes gene_type:complete
MRGENTRIVRATRVSPRIFVLTLSSSPADLPAKRRRLMEALTTTIEGAKKATGLGTTTIYSLIHEKRLETVKVGRRTLIKVSSIRALVEAA